MGTAIMLRRLCIGAACLALFAGTRIANAQGVVLTPVRASERVYYFQGAGAVPSAANKGFTSNAGFVITGEGVVVFDALGTPALGEAIIAAIGSVTKEPIKLVIVSHYHADHVYGLQAFADRRIPIWANEKGRAYLQSPASAERLAQRRAELAPWVDERTRVVAADRWLRFASPEGIPFALGKVKFRLIEAGGAHSPEDIMLWVEDERLLFAGDLYFTGRIPYVGSADSKAWLLALDKVVRLEPRTVIPGHGAMSTRVSEDIGLTRRYLGFLREKMGAAVQDLKSFDEAYAEIDWSSFSSQPAFEAANRINAYGTYLQMQSEMLRTGK